MAPYIFDQKNGIHIIDLHKSIVKIDEAANVLKQLARSGRKVLFVATKKQAKEIVAEKAGSDKHALRDREMAGRNAYKLPDNPQGCQEDEYHRQDD